MLAKRLDKLTEHGVLLLHDRRIPATRANIDHIAVGPGGVYVIDAKRYKGRPHMSTEGSILQPRVEKLMVGSRDCTKLVQSMHKQTSVETIALTTAGITDVPVHGMLCFVQADWPAFGGSFTIDGVTVLWPRKASEMIAAGKGLAPERVLAVHRELARRLPAA